MPPAVARDPERGDRGLVLLALLLVLLGGSALWLVHGVPPSIDRESLVGRRSVADMERRRRAREALLAHAALYPWLYGPTGAGPAHLPCPDTDAPAGALRMPMRAGPNPPCAARPSVVGALPLHVTIGTLRSALDPVGAFDPALGYRVAAEVVNNPRGREVNGRLALARVLRISDAPRASRHSVGSIDVTSAALLEPAERAIAVWAIEQIAALPSDLVRRLCQASEPCRVLDALASGIAMPQASSDFGTSIDGTASDAAGGSGATALALLDAVPQARHWFVRNGWNDDIELGIALVCRTATVRCRWEIDDRARRMARRGQRDSAQGREPVPVMLPPLHVRLEPIAPSAAAVK